MTSIRRCLAVAVASSLSFASLTQPAQAALIGTAELAGVPGAAGVAADRSAAHEQLHSALERADVSAALQARGVDLDAARARVAALTDAEAAYLAQQIDLAPAGGDSLLGVLVFIFVLLLVTDILGLTKVFPFTKSVR
ncbi:MAG TPA: PA2779 family protein [Rubrivivax sp.]